MRISIPHRRLVGTLAFVALSLAAASFASQVYKHRFNASVRLPNILQLDGENNLGSFFSVLLLLSAAGLLTFICLVHRRLKAPFVWHWLGLAAAFLYLAVDEGIGLHEKLTGITQRLAGSQSGLFLLAWVVPVGGVLLGFGAAYVRFLWHLPARHRWAFMGAGALYVSGALGMEIVGGYYMQVQGWNLTLYFLMTLEESMEMFGLIAFLAALLRYLREEMPDLTFHFGHAPAPRRHLTGRSAFHQPSPASRPMVCRKGS